MADNPIEVKTVCFTSTEPNIGDLSVVDTEGNHYRFLLSWGTVRLLAMQLISFALLTNGDGK